jgi:cation:H+ antiporter
MPVHLLIIAVSILALWYGANWLVAAATRIARRLGISDLIIGLTVVAIGTSAPEFAVTVSAALRGQAEISAGNVVGSNIFNLGFILGGMAFWRAITTTRKLVLRDGLLLVGVTALIVGFLADDLLRGQSHPYLARWEGGIMLLLLLSWLTYLIYQREAPADEVAAGEFRRRDMVQFLAGMAMIAIGGHYLVSSAIVVATALGISEWVVSVTVVAFGTSAPEMATSFVALLRGQSDISIGNLIGSNVFNLLGVLGLAALLQPLEVDDPGAWLSVLLMLGMVVVVVGMMRTQWRISRREGGVLLLISIAYLLQTVLAGQG